MLLEIFNNVVYMQTCEDENTPSRKVPYTMIMEQSHEAQDQYYMIKDFLLYMLDKPGYGLRNGGHYALTINRSKVNYNTYRFDFTFDKNNVKDWQTIAGAVVYNSETKDIIQFWRNSTAVDINDPEIQSDLNCEKMSFDGRCEGSCASASDDQDNTISFDSDSFVMNDDNTIEVVSPSNEELHSVTVGKGNSFTINLDPKRQASQKDFLKTMSKKISNSSAANRSIQDKVDSYIKNS